MSVIHLCIAVSLLFSEVQPPPPYIAMVSHELRYILVAHEILGPTEVDAFTYYFRMQQDLKDARKSINLLRDAPLLADLDFFQRWSANDIDKSLEVNLKYRLHVDEVKKLYPDDQDAVDILQECDYLNKVWTSLRTAKSEKGYFVETRRLALKSLRNYLGPTNYYAGLIAAAPPVLEVQRHKALTLKGSVRMPAEGPNLNRMYANSCRIVYARPGELSLNELEDMAYELSIYFLQTHLQKREPGGEWTTFNCTKDDVRRQYDVALEEARSSLDRMPTQGIVMHPLTNEYVTLCSTDLGVLETEMAHAVVDKITGNVVEDTTLMTLCYSLGRKSDSEVAALYKTGDPRGLKRRFFNLRALLGDDFDWTKFLLTEVVCKSTTKR